MQATTSELANVAGAAYVPMICVNEKALTIGTDGPSKIVEHALKLQVVTAGYLWKDVSTERTKERMKGMIEGGSLVVRILGRFFGTEEIFGFHGFRSCDFFCVSDGNSQEVAGRTATLGAS
jgi:hypothetical protein